MKIKPSLKRAIFICYDNSSSYFLEVNAHEQRVNKLIQCKVIPPKSTWFIEYKQKLKVAELCFLLRKKKKAIVKLVDKVANQMRKKKKSNWKILY